MQVNKSEIEDKKKILYAIISYFDRSFPFFVRVRNTGKERIEVHMCAL